ncbi:MAG: hypothetical protein KKE39_02740 [Bacteroidetes bacterium]|nr:hypothetical protein [Bacteroidota bacterium]MBU1372249.1 hypothetical protein [Bacteroidota bacterium]MBU1484500.1 hypothetical protein [Bacteroidota bacterium]MBU1759720.1 hypothetical protein [Bacteroidota bacterium]MBU2046615.1 hypothetical protein [Bacteroidota bacterium]
MKKVKFLLVMATLLAVPAAFAFTQYHRTLQEWAYDGSGSVLAPENYVLVETSPACEGTASICTIMAPDDGNGEPDLSDTGLQSRITNKDTSNGDVFLKN